MKLKITGRKLNDPEELRSLLIDAKEELAGENCRILEPRLPWEGHPILMVDTALHPVVVSFDIKRGETALLNGLRNVEHLSGLLPWINQVNEPLQQRQQPAKLVVVSEAPVPGDVEILSANQYLSVFRCRVLEVNGDTGLWLEPCTRTTAPDAQHRTEESKVDDPAPARPYVVAPGRPAEDPLPELSEEENAYFQQL